MLAYPQTITLIALKNFSFKLDGKGRAIVVKTGDRFWVTSSQSDQSRRGFVCIARQRQPLHYNYCFSRAALKDLFQAEAR
jgi:hypothetical protein